MLCPELKVYWIINMRTVIAPSKYSQLPSETGVRADLWTRFAFQESYGEVGKIYLLRV